MNYYLLYIDSIFMDLNICLLRLLDLNTVKNFILKTKVQLVYPYRIVMVMILL